MSDGTAGSGDTQGQPRVLAEPETHIGKQGCADQGITKGPEQKIEGIELKKIIQSAQEEQAECHGKRADYSKPAGTEAIRDIAPEHAK